ncbi:hypothetical protein CMI42_03990 [Candidatus Pacearchaeota archaeon]|nr:hypothetical protein [Candidatus Pacearchaeota archaeon]|tara:strand:+ start:2681 stop:3376 length:696 start_codon:yes stop_codon:yes gene_type:complete
MKCNCLIFDAGPLINFSMNGILYLLEGLKENFKGDFLITKEVKKEVIDKPLGIKRFELEALRLERLYKKGVIKLADLSKGEVDELREIRDGIINKTNNTFRTKKKYLHIIDKGEAAAFALSTIMKRKCGLDVPIVVDERTARVLSENPGNMRKLFEKKFHTSVSADKGNYDLLRDFKIIRSTELVYIAYRKGLFKLKDPRTLEAMLYGVKFKGCSISEKEVRQLIEMGKVV